MPVVAAPALVAVCAALLALLILWGVAVLVKAIGSIIPKGIPIIGDWLHNAVVNLATAAMAVVQWVMADLIRPVINFILAPVYRFLDLMSALVTFTRNMAASWAWLVGTALPDAFAKAKDWATHEAKVAEAWAGNHLDALGRDLRGLISGARDYAAHLVAVASTALHLAIHDARAAAHQALVGVEHDLTRAIDHTAAVAASALAGVKAEVYGTLHTVEHSFKAADQDLSNLITSTAASTLSAAEHFTTVQIGKLAGTLTVDIPGVVAPVWDGLIDDVGTLEGVIGSDFPDLRGLLGSLAGTGALDASLAIAGTATMARVLSRYLTECGIPNCRNLSAIGRALQDLFGVVEGAAFLALLAEMIADPAQAAQDLDSFLTPIVDPLVTGARDLLGV